jgi:lipid-binding SYLF domain-containing protein
MDGAVIRCVCAVVTATLTGIPALPTLAEEPGDWRSLKREAKRQRIDEVADFALKKVLASNPKAEGLFDKSYGWAVFDNLKLALVFSGGGGNGVAVTKGSGERTYMKMGTVGIGLGLGGKKYQLVFLFQDEQTFSNFVEKGWQADAQASAVAGNEGANVQTDFVNGLAVYQVTDTGLMASADIAGTKYWKNKKLNR